MTQLFIAGVEVVLPKEFSTSVKRENSLFTKNGEYTYDVTLSLNNPINKALWPQWRLNNSKNAATKRSAVLIADNRIYCNGTEVITGWSESSVTIQIVSGNSELNYFIGQDLEIKWLTSMGEVSASDVNDTSKDSTDSRVWPSEYCLPMMYNETTDHFINKYDCYYDQATKKSYAKLDRTKRIRVQPYVTTIINKILSALGYTINYSQIETTDYKYLFICNYIDTLKYCEMFPGWTVKALLEEFEKLLDIVFVVDNQNKECNIYFATAYYLNSTQKTIKNVVDTYEVEVETDGNNISEHSTSNIKITVPDVRYYKLQQLSDTILGQATKVTVNSFSDVLQTLNSSTAVKKLIVTDQSSGRQYIKVDQTKTNTSSDGAFDDNTTPDPSLTNNPNIMEVNSFAEITRDETTDSDIEIEVVPAPFAWHTYKGHLEGRVGVFMCEMISIADSTDTSDSITADTPDTDTTLFDDYISSSTETSTEAKCQLYVAFYNGWKKNAIGPLPLAYTDAIRASQTGCLMHDPLPGYEYDESLLNGPRGSLRLKDLDADLYAGIYTIDTTKAISIETFDPNKYDVRNVFIINNKRYVCNYIEETIVANGRQKKWKGIFYPITISDTTAYTRWVLSSGNWDDGGVWIDDGKWID